MTDTKEDKKEEFTEKELQERLKTIQELTFDEQIKAFLKAFAGEFISGAISGGFEKVLDLGEKFRKYIKPGSDNQLDEQQFHKFLEDHVEAQTIKLTRDQLRAIDLDFNMRVSIIEYLLSEYKKTLQELFSTKKKGDPKALAALEKAIAAHILVLKTKRERAEKEEELKAKIAAGGDDAKHAKGELFRLTNSEKAKEGEQEIGALAEKLKAQRLVKQGGGDHDEAFREEQARLAEVKRQEEAEKKKKAEESKAKLAARAALFGGTATPSSPKSPKSPK